MRNWSRRALGLWLCMGLCACNPGVKADPDVQRGVELTGKPQPRVLGPRIDERDIADEPPFVGEVGVDSDGYPTEQPDRVKLLGLLRLKRFAALERFMEHYQSAFEQDFHKELWPIFALSAFFITDPSLEPILDEWVAHSPKSFAALAARGNYRQALGWHYRGGRYAARTSRAEFASMHEYFVAAQADYRRALELRPKFVAAHGRLLSIAKADSAPAAVKTSLLEEALKICPLCYQIRATWMDGLEPKWGGSYEAMQQFAEANKGSWSHNPRLKLLTGFADAERCARAMGDDDLREALVACERALKAGDATRALTLSGELRNRQKQHAEALPLLDRALRKDPQHPEALEARYIARRELGNYVAAAEDLLVARHLDPTAQWLAKQVEWMVQRLRYDGQELDKAGKHAEAAKIFSLALQLAPGDRDLAARIAWSGKQADTTPEAVQAQLTAAPDDFDLRRRIDYALAALHRYPEVVAMWDEFIARHPTDPRAKSERAGAHWHLKQIDQALADMQSACDLGMKKACADVRAMKSRAGIR